MISKDMEGIGFGLHELMLGHFPRDKEEKLEIAH
jgi:hypothetical protein